MDKKRNLGKNNFSGALAAPKGKNGRCFIFWWLLMAQMLFFLLITMSIFSLALSAVPKGDGWRKDLFSGTPAALKDQKWRRFLFLVDFDGKNALFSVFQYVISHTSIECAWKIGDWKIYCLACWRRLEAKNGTAIVLVFFYFEGAHAFFLHIVISFCTLGVSAQEMDDRKTCFPALWWRLKAKNGAAFCFWRILIAKMQFFLNIMMSAGTLALIAPPMGDKCLIQWNRK